LDSLWSRLLEAVAQKLAPAVIDQWVQPCRLLAIEGDHLKIGAPNPFSRDWLIQHHLQALQQAAQSVLGGQPRVTIVVDEMAEPGLSADAPPPRAPRAGGGSTEGLNPRYTFDTFVVGSSNQFAQAASQAVAELPSKAYNPLFIYGGVGLGKTHLLHAVGHQSAKLFPGMAVVYITSERFTNELINAIRYDRTSSARATATATSS
jgi:chromosomal replication initiator protein